MDAIANLWDRKRTSSELKQPENELELQRPVSKTQAFSGLKAPETPRFILDSELQLSVSRAHNSTRLCTRCKSLNLGEKIEETIQSPPGFSIPFSLNLSQQEISCAFCQLFHNFKTSPFLKLIYLDARWPGRASPSKSIYLVQRRQTKQDHGHHTCKFMPSSYSSPLSDWPYKPLGVDYKELRTVIGCCTGQHVHVNSTDRRDGSHLLKAINCTTRQVEQIKPETQYVALSYAWGSSQLPADSMANHEYLPDSLGKTIEDAITVTLNLRYNHLWVDKYCIDQTNAAKKHEQIQEMDRVYAGADLTLVAAAGEDAQFGLPGVSTRPRSSRQSLRLGNYVLSTCWDPKLLQKHVERSKWMQRGWAFQEALLSKKRIFFTEYCYLYDCKTCCSRGYQLDRLEPRNPPSRLRLEHHSWMPYSSFEEAGQFYARVREFSKRTLTYQSDALNAMAGIFRRFEDLQQPVHNFWGVPIIHPKSSVSSRSRVTAVDSFVRGLACSVSKVGGRRRTGFPSWSWAGWEAACHPLHYWDSAEPTAVRVEIELRSGKRINWPEFEARCFLKQEPPHVSGISTEQLATAG